MLTYPNGVKIVTTVSSVSYPNVRTGRYDDNTHGMILLFDTNNNMVASYYIDHFVYGEVL